MGRFQKIAGPMTVYSTASPGTPVEFPLAPRFVGDSASAIQYMIRVLTRSSSALQLGLRLDHGPDGTVSVTHSTPIALTAPSSVPSVLAGDATTSTTKIAPWVHPVVLVDIASGATQRFGTIEVYELVETP